MTSISNLSSKSRAIRSFLLMCLAGLDRRSQTSHKDGNAHFENNISHKDHIQLFLTCLDTLFHVVFHLFLNHLTNIHCFTINVSAGLSRGIKRIWYGPIKSLCRPSRQFRPIIKFGPNGPRPGFACRNPAETKVVVYSVRSGSEGIIMPSFTTVIAALMFPSQGRLSP